MKIYIAGPMTGLPEFNFPAFFAAEERLKRAGYTTFNPARRDVEEDGIDVSGTSGNHHEVPGFDLRKALDADTTYICREADAIYMMTGWEHSLGASAEHALAKVLRLVIMYEHRLIGEHGG